MRDMTRVFPKTCKIKGVTKMVREKTKPVLYNLDRR